MKATDSIFSNFLRQQIEPDELDRWIESLAAFLANCPPWWVGTEINHALLQLKSQAARAGSQPPSIPWITMLRIKLLARRERPQNLFWNLILVAFLMLSVGFGAAYALSAPKDSLDASHIKVLAIAAVSTAVSIIIGWCRTESILK